MFLSFVRTTFPLVNIAFESVAVVGKAILLIGRGIF